MSHEIIYIKKGEIELVINGHYYTACENTIIFISCLEEHSTNILSSEYERYYLNVSPKKLDKLIGDPRLVSVCKNRPEVFNHCFKAPDYAEQIFCDIIIEYQKSDSYSQELITAGIKRLLIDLYRQSPEKFPIPSKGVKSEILEAQRYIEKNFKQAIVISELADMLYVNKYYLTHSFKELTGYSPKQYLLLNRLSYAKELLQSTDFDISEIAEKSGFYDSNSFIRTFKNEYDVTPNVYRKQN